MPWNLERYSRLLKSLIDIFPNQSKRLKKISNEVLRHPYEKSEKMQKKIEPIADDENVQVQMHEVFDVNDG